MTANIAKIKEAANANGCVACKDSPTTCFRATAKTGLRFENGLHELVAPYGNGILGNGDSEQQAMQDLHERIVDHGILEACDDRDCDWCESEGAAWSEQLKVWT